MNWREEALEKLRSYERMRVAERNLKLEIRRLKLEERRISSSRADVVAVRQSGSQAEERLLDNMQRRQALEEALEQTRCWIRVTDAALGTLDKKERLILWRLYIQSDPSTIALLCEQLGVEKSSVYRNRDKALQKFIQALYGAAESKDGAGA